MTKHLSKHDMLQGYDHCMELVCKSYDVERKKLTVLHNYECFAYYVAELLNRTEGRILRTTIENIIDALKKHKVPVKARIDHIIDKVLFIRFPVDREMIYSKVCE